MEAESKGRGSTRPTRRRALRYRVEAPLDVTVLRSGIPDKVPGRSENLGVYGLGAVMAGELQPGESVGLEIQLPANATSLRIRAMVRYHDKLRCGLEFIGISADQQASIRDCTDGTKAEPEPGQQAKLEPEKGADGQGGSSVRPSAHASSADRLSAHRVSTQRRRSRGWGFLILAVILLASVGWWEWDRGWENLESGLRKNESAIQPQAHVPADVMERLVRHRVDPDYPAAARPQNLKGIIVLDVIVGRDGSVAEVHALNGPEILADAATGALRWWRFEPYKVNGQPVVAETTVAVEFKP
ncbi:MAG: energy transducer TonB [Candidatus Sulfotelmatobacter sp.]